MGRSTTTKETIPIPIIHTFRISDSNSTSADYELINTTGESTWLSEGIRVSRNRHYKSPDPQYFISTVVDGSWPKLIELYSCFSPCVLIGYSREENKVGDTLLVRLNPYERTVVIYCFKGYYSKNMKPLFPFMKKL